MNPYELKKKTECNKEARQSLFSDPKLNADTKGKKCGDMSAVSTE